MRLFTATAAVLAVIGYLSLNSPQYPGSNLFSTKHEPMRAELEHEFINFIAKYGKTYASKEEITKHFAIFLRDISW